MLEQTLNKLFTAIIISILFACSCSDNRVMRELSDIEVLLDDKPESALVLLNNINKITINTKRGMAEYSLL